MNRRDAMKTIGAASWLDMDFVRMAIEMADENPLVAEYLDELHGKRGLAGFRPRPDDLDAAGCPDQQSSFVYNKDGVAFLIGGNGAGTSVAAAFKAARFMLLEQPPPRKNTPFWVMSNTFENTCNVCWGEKLQGMGFIPACEIEHISYHNKARNQPQAVILKPWPVERGGHPDKNWVIEFKTFEQGRSALQGASLGGFWISETPSAQLCAEAVRGLRDYDFRGARMIEFTPLDPWLSLEMDQAIERHAQITHDESWNVYRANTMCNLPNLPGGQSWVDSMLAFTPEELWNTRLYGDFAVFENQIYAGFSESIHMIDEEFVNPRVTGDNVLIHAMGTDWGWTSEHAHCTVWAYWDPRDGSWTVYDEYWTVSQTKILRDHVTETLERCEKWGWPFKHDNGHRSLDLTQRPGYKLNHADSAAPGNIREYCRYGVPTVGYQKTDNSVLEGIYYLKHLLTPQQQTGEPLLKISSRCKHLINEMRMYRWKRGQTNMMALNPGLAKPVPMPRFDHGPDALRYMIMGHRKYEGWESPKFVQRDERIAGRNAERAVRVASGRPYPSGRARSLVRFER
jgi:phage terminase large subunit-like protein